MEHYYVTLSQVTYLWPGLVRGKVQRGTISRHSAPLTATGQAARHSQWQGDPNIQIQDAQLFFDLETLRSWLVASLVFQVVIVFKAP